MTAAAANPSYKVVVVGHSLGGAIAAIAATELRNAGTSTDLYTYGQPRIGGLIVSNNITNQNLGGNFRVTHLDDPVPRLPPLILGFVHISPEYYINTGNNVVVTAGDITKHSGPVNIFGNTGNIGNGADIAVSHLSQSFSIRRHSKLRVEVLVAKASHLSILSRISG
jgi:alpha-beta hydrolase superfamily lysophospholipase